MKKNISSSRHYEDINIISHKNDIIINMKFNNKITEIDGIKFDSKMEAEYYLELKLRKRANDIKDFSRQIKFDLESNNIKVGTYIIDFKIIHNDDTAEYVEVKGKVEDLWVLKWNLLSSLLDNRNGVVLSIACKGKTKEELEKKRSVFIKPTNWYYL